MTKRQPSRRRLPVGVEARQLADGTFTYVARWSDSTGKRQKATFDTSAEADAHRQEMLRNRRRGGSGSLTGSRLPFSVWWKRWLESRQTRDSTTARDISYGRYRLVPHFGTRPLGSIRPTDISAYLSSLQADGLAPSTVLKHLQILSKCLDAAVNDDLIGTNPAKRVERPEQDDKEATVLDPAQVLDLEAATDPWWRLTIPFMLDTATRIGEVSAVRVEDIYVLVRINGEPRKVPAHMTNGRAILGGGLTVRATSVEVSKEVSGRAKRRNENAPKTRAGKREVPTITASVAERLVALVHERQLAPGDFLFKGPRRGPMSPHNFRERVFNPAVDAAGLGEISPTPHTIRHTGVSIWIATGVTDPLKIARWAGHRSVKSVYDTYGHLMPDSSDGIREKLEALRQSLAEPQTRGQVVGMRDDEMGDTPPV